MLEEQTGAAGVLTADELGVSQGLDGAWSEVAEVADRSRNQPEGAHAPGFSAVRCCIVGADLDEIADTEPPAGERAASASMTERARVTGIPTRWRCILMVLITTPSASR